jgi:hypothetical protein
LYNNGTSIGIDTALPRAKLDVAKAWGTGGGNDVAAIFGDSTNNGYNIYLIGHTLNAGWDRANDTGALYLNYRGYQGGNAYFRDTVVANGKAGTIARFKGSNGFVGIGNNNPDTKLVVGDGTGYGNIIAVQGSDNQWAGYRLNIGTTAPTEKWFIGTNSDTSNDLLFRRNAANNDMVINNKGQVVIGGNGLPQTENVKLTVKPDTVQGIYVSNNLGVSATMAIGMSGVYSNSPDSSTGIGVEARGGYAGVVASSDAGTAVNASSVSGKGVNAYSTSNTAGYFRSIGQAGVWGMTTNGDAAVKGSVYSPGAGFAGKFEGGRGIYVNGTGGVVFPNNTTAPNDGVSRIGVENTNYDLTLYGQRNLFLIFDEQPVGVGGAAGGKLMIGVDSPWYIEGTGGAAPYNTPHPYFVIANDGKVGIGVLNPAAAQLEVNGEIKIMSSSLGTCNASKEGAIAYQSGLPGHFYGCAKTSGGGYVWKFLDN